MSQSRCRGGISKIVKVGKVILKEAKKERYMYTTGSLSPFGELSEKKGMRAFMVIRDIDLEINDIHFIEKLGEEERIVLIGLGNEFANLLM